MATKTSDNELLRAIKHCGSQRKAAKFLGLHSRTVERRLAVLAEPAIAPRILVLDIETAPNLVYSWGLFKQTIGVNQIVTPGRVLCFAARWHGEDKTVFYSERQPGGAERMIAAAHKLLSEADAVAGWNSQRFDVRWLNAEFKRHGLRRVAGYRHIDLMKSVKKHQYHPSYKLDYTARFLGLDGKVQTGGFDLWRDCMNGDREAWALMEEYNRHDTELTDAVLADMRQGGWATGLPNLSVDGGECCPNCGSERLQADGYVLKLSRRYRKWICLDCQSPSESIKSEPGSAKLKAAA